MYESLIAKLLLQTNPRVRQNLVLCKTLKRTKACAVNMRLARAYTRAAWLMLRTYLGYHIVAAVCWCISRLAFCVLWWLQCRTKLASSRPQHAVAPNDKITLIQSPGILYFQVKHGNSAWQPLWLVLHDDSVNSVPFLWAPRVRSRAPAGRPGAPPPGSAARQPSACTPPRGTQPYQIEHCNGKLCECPFEYDLQ